MLVGDEFRIRQILLNLLSNAIKFTDSGKVDIAVGLEDFEAGLAHLHFRVTDTGIGLSAENQALVFDAFRQADGSTTRRYGGTGLGLSICSKLVQTDGRAGYGWTASLGQGSTFHFSLSLAAAPAPGRGLPIRRGDAAPAGDRQPAVGDPAGGGQRGQT